MCKSVLKISLKPLSVKEVVHYLGESQSADEHLVKCDFAHLVIVFLADLVSLVYSPYSKSACNHIFTPLIRVAFLELLDFLFAWLSDHCHEVENSAI